MFNKEPKNIQVELWDLSTLEDGIQLSLVNSQRRTVSEILMSHFPEEMNEKEETPKVEIVNEEETPKVKEVSSIITMKNLNDMNW